MKSRKTSHGYLLVLKKGETLIDSLVKFCETQKIQAGWVSGIGAVSEAEIGYYHLAKKQYAWQRFNSVMEITSLNGNIAVVKGKLTPHLHVSLSDEQYQVYGGHLKQATIGGTCEILMRVLDEPLTRQPDQDTGLNLLDL